LAAGVLVTGGGAGAAVGAWATLAAGALVGSTVLVGNAAVGGTEGGGPGVQAASISPHAPNTKSRLHGNRM